MQVRRQRVWYYDSGAIDWIFNDKCHRDRDLPAYYYFEHKELIFIAYYQHGKFHRTTGPAYINYKAEVKEYYYQGRKYGSLEEMMMLEACG